MAEETWWPSETEYTPNISKEQWLELLRDESIFNFDSMCLMRCFLNIGGEATCTDLAMKYGRHSNFYNRNSSSLALRIQKATGCKMPPEREENARWWPILYVGRYVNKSENKNGVYVWKLRNELEAALSEKGLRHNEKYPLCDNDFFDENLLAEMAEKFIVFVNYNDLKNNKPCFSHFSSDDYITSEEFYKTRLWVEINSEKNHLEKISDFGSGQVLSKLLSWIERKGNNLLVWDDRYGKDTSYVKELHDLPKDKDKLKEFEQNTHSFFFGKMPDKDYFEYFIQAINRHYPLVAYIFFLKNRNDYMPLAPTTFDRMFSEIGMPLRTAKNCSWENYIAYNSALKKIQDFLKSYLSDEITLLDAHSFCWICQRQMKYAQQHGYRPLEKLVLAEKERETFVKACIGQGKYRELLLKKWNNTCSVLEYSNTKFLEAAHIKEWKDCNNEECVDVDNGLLLTPNLHALFDAGYISFDDDGKLKLSAELTDDDIAYFGLSENVRIRFVNQNMKQYLSWHRKNVFKG